MTAMAGMFDIAEQIAIPHFSYGELRRRAPLYETRGTQPAPVWVGGGEGDIMQHAGLIVNSVADVDAASTAEGEAWS
jgi:hypothetical protein